MKGKTSLSSEESDLDVGIRNSERTEKHSKVTSVSSRMNSEVSGACGVDGTGIAAWITPLISTDENGDAISLANQEGAAGDLSMFDLPLSQRLRMKSSRCSSVKSGNVTAEKACVMGASSQPVFQFNSSRGKHSTDSSEDELLVESNHQTLVISNKNSKRERIAISDSEDEHVFELVKPRTWGNDPEDMEPEKSQYRTKTQVNKAFHSGSSSDFGVFVDDDDKILELPVRRRSGPEQNVHRTSSSSANEQSAAYGVKDDFFLQNDDIIAGVFSCRPPQQATKHFAIDADDERVANTGANVLPVTGLIRHVADMSIDERGTQNLGTTTVNLEVHNVHSLSGNDCGTIKRTAGEPSPTAVKSESMRIADDSGRVEVGPQVRKHISKTDVTRGCFDLVADFSADDETTVIAAASGRARNGALTWSENVASVIPTSSELSGHNPTLLVSSQSFSEENPSHSESVVLQANTPTPEDVVSDLSMMNLDTRDDGVTLLVNKFPTRWTHASPAPTCETVLICPHNSGNNTPVNIDSPDCVTLVVDKLPRKSSKESCSSKSPLCETVLGSNRVGDFSGMNPNSPNCVSLLVDKIRSNCPKSSTSCWDETVVLRQHDDKGSIVNLENNATSLVCNMQRKGTVASAHFSETVVIPSDCESDFPFDSVSLLVNQLPTREEVKQTGEKMSRTAHRLCDTVVREQVRHGDVARQSAEDMSLIEDSPEPLAETFLVDVTGIDKYDSILTADEIIGSGNFCEASTKIPVAVFERQCVKGEGNTHEKSTSDLNPSIMDTGVRDEPFQVAEAGSVSTNPSETELAENRSVSSAPLREVSLVQNHTLRGPVGKGCRGKENLCLSATSSKARVRCGTDGVHVSGKVTKRIGHDKRQDYALLLKQFEVNDESDDSILGLVDDVLSTRAKVTKKTSKLRKEAVKKLLSPSVVDEMTKSDLVDDAISTKQNKRRMKKTARRVKSGAS